MAERNFLALEETLIPSPKVLVKEAKHVYKFCKVKIG
jgi:hypothetical protein